jgi:molybdenum cofactor cytidylyltransferase
MVCDQPHVNAALLMELIDESAATDASATACSYSGVVGVPAVFARRIWSKLLELEGDQGARRLLLACDDIVAVEFSDAAVDVDTPEDLAALRGESG